MASTPPPPPPPARKRAAPLSKLAVAGLVCSLVAAFIFPGSWLGLVFGVLGVSLGFAGWREIKSSAGQLGAAWIAYVAWGIGLLAIIGPF